MVLDRVVWCGVLETRRLDLSAFSEGKVDFSLPRQVTRTWLKLPLSLACLALLVRQTGMARS